jgi:hypothetical protein
VNVDDARLVGLAGEDVGGAADKDNPPVRDCHGLGVGPPTARVVWGIARRDTFDGRIWPRQGVDTTARQDQISRLRPDAAARRQAKGKTGGQEAFQIRAHYL